MLNKQFFFDGNLFNGIVQSEEDWLKLCRSYNISSDEMLKAKEKNGPKENPRNFGFRIEHDDEYSLKDFFADNKIIWKKYRC